MHAKMIWTGRVETGAGGATAAFQYADGRRCREVEAIIGVRPYPGSLNVRLTAPFAWGGPHYEGTVLDVVARGRGLDVEWKPRTVRLYPVAVECAPGVVVEAWAFRFDGERYRDDFVELVAGVRLRDYLKGEEVRLWEMSP